MFGGQNNGLAKALCMFHPISDYNMYIASIFSSPHLSALTPVILNNSPFYCFHEPFYVGFVKRAAGVQIPTHSTQLFCPVSPAEYQERGGHSLYVGAVPTEVTERKLTMEEEEAKRIAEMGKPILGEHPKLEVIIEESYEFKVSAMHQTLGEGTREGTTRKRVTRRGRAEKE